MASSCSSTSQALSRVAHFQKHLNPNPNPKGEGIVKISPLVAEALSLGKPVVALESTIISHGLPYPQNLETAKEVEGIVRQNGAIPATIAILDGAPCVGLSLEELERLAILGKKARKTARRDIAHVVATGGNGATTVSATMFFADMVGIPIFVTGGIGGVHRHGETTMDISSDLTELGRTPVTVVSAGVKSILDISRTLEYLETQGVCVAAYQTNELPAFFTEKSGYKAPCRVDSPEECARLIDANINLKLGNGILIAVPIPSEHSASGNMIESAIQKALMESAIWEQNITGSAETPFLLAKVNELTGGASLLSNIALVKNNARLALRLQSPCLICEKKVVKVANGADGSSKLMIREANNSADTCKNHERVEVEFFHPRFSTFAGFVSTALSAFFPQNLFSYSKERLLRLCLDQKTRG